MNKQAVCVKVKQDVEGVKTFYFKSTETLAFDAGQFITLSLSTDNGEIQRSYTVSSSPENTSTFSITVRAVPEGHGSNWLHENLQAGDNLDFSGPYGRFVPVEHEQQKLLLLAAGSGITPFLSTFRSWRDRGISVDAQLIYSVRSPEQIIEYQELSSLCDNIDGLSITILPAAKNGQNWDGILGRLDEFWLPAICRDIASRTTYACGPTPYMEMIKQYLRDTGIGLDNYFEEAFVSPIQTSASTLISESDDEFTIHFANSDITVTSSGNTTLLDIAESAGVTVKTACKSGICGSCMTMKKSGNVDMQDLGGILPSEESKGMILMCCSKPTSDIVLEI